MSRTFYQILSTGESALGRTCREYTSGQKGTRDVYNFASSSAAGH